ncbi:hypothetical protein KCP70_19700 [Salmonella enterica subsp. enterica]|nr:hypothetical protein KCP70_19700 [Salmonella enterica subsp. enterica]
MISSIGAGYWIRSRGMPVLSKTGALPLSDHPNTVAVNRKLEIWLGYTVPNGECRYQKPVLTYSGDTPSVQRYR